MLFRCFGIPFGAVGCSIANAVAPGRSSKNTADVRQHYYDRAIFKDLCVTVGLTWSFLVALCLVYIFLLPSRYLQCNSDVTGQICVDLATIFPIIATGRSADDMHCGAESFTDFFRYF